MRDQSRPAELSLTEPRELRQRLFGKLSERMAKEGFRLNKSLERYVRGQGDVELQYWVLTTVLPDGSVSVDPGVGVRHHAVEEIYHRCSGVAAKWQKHSPTYSIDLWRWVARERGLADGALREEFIQKVTCTAIAESAAVELHRAYKQFACLFFERYSALPELGNLFGNQLGAHLHGLPVRNICTGLIVSKLTARPDFQAICDLAIEKVGAIGDSVSVAQVECLIKEVGKGEAKGC